MFFPVEFPVSFVLWGLVFLQLAFRGVELTNPELGVLDDHIANQNKAQSLSSPNTPGVVNISMSDGFSSRCVVKKYGHVYDLSKLAQRKFWFYSEPFDADSDSSLIFLLSICRPIENVSTCQNNSGVCFAYVKDSTIDSQGHKLKESQDLNDISFTTIGTVPEKGPEVLQEGSLKYVYDFGGVCMKGINKQAAYVVELHLQCPRSSHSDNESPGPLLMVSPKCIYIFVWMTYAACPKRIESTSDPCIKKFSSSEYPLNLHSLHTGTFYKAYGMNSSFEINICGPIQNGSCLDNTAICDTSDPQNPKVLATSEEINFDWEEDALILSYKNLKSEIVSSTNIYLYCDRHAFTPRLFFSSNSSNTYNFSIYTINVCNPEPSDCVFEDKKLNVYDLRPLYKKEENWEVVRKSGNTTIHYLLNVCGPINPEKYVKCTPGPVGACQSSVSITGSRNIGYITSNPFVNEDGSITLMYTGGHSCKDGVLSSSTRISFVCSTIDYPPVFVRVTESCEHVFEWHTPAACPVSVVSSSDCRVSDPLFGHNFDIRPLRNVSVDYQVGSGNYSFRINVCGPLVTSCGGDEKAAVCQGEPGEEKSGGEVPAELLFNDGTMIMRFSNGTPGCGDGRWASQMLLLCSHDEKGVDGLQYIHADEGACVHHFLWHTPQACPPITDVECRVKDGGVTYDLTPLSNPDLNEVYITRERARKYILNVCRSVVHSKESRCAYDAGACLIDLSHENKTLSLGRVGSGPFVERGQLKLRYEGGDTCNATHAHSTVIDFECARDQYLSYPVLSAEESCSTVFKWRTVYACSRGESETPGATFAPANGCTAVNPLTDYVFDMNPLKTEKPYELPMQEGVSLLITACGAVKDPRCGEEDAGACLVRTGAGESSSAGRANQALNFHMWSTYLDYEGGEECPNGLRRSTRVSFICREDAKVVGPVLIAEDAEACTFFVHWYTEEACERHIRCFAHSWERTFDLSPLIRDRDNYRVKDPNDPDSLYLINVCRPLNPVIGVNCHPGSSSCLVRKNQEPLGLGHPILNPTVVSSSETEDQVHLMYSHGSDCPSDPNFSLSSRIIFICNRSAGAGAPRFLRKVNECQIQFEWETSVVCPPPEEDEEGQGECQIAYEAAKTNVDLSPLRRERPYNVSHGDASFLLNICGATACKDGEAAVCTSDGRSYGRSTKSQLLWDHDGLLVLTFYGGPPCDGAITGSRSARIFFECDLDAGLGVPRADPAMDDLHCMAVFNWRTNLTCLEALYQTPAPAPPAPVPAPNPGNTSQLPPESQAGIQGGGDDSSQHTWVSALIAGTVLTGVVAASIYVVGRSAFGRRLYARAKRTLARKGYASAAESDTLLQGETAFVYRVDEDEQVLRV